MVQELAAELELLSLACRHALLRKEEDTRLLQEDDHRLTFIFLKKVKKNRIVQLLMKNIPEFFLIA